MIEKLLFKKVGLWVLLLVFLGCLVAAVLFGWGVRHEYKGGQRLGAFGEFLVDVAAVPNTIKKLVLSSAEDFLAREQRFDGVGGFYFGYPEGSKPDLGYLLLSRYNGDGSRSEIELVDLNTQRPVHRWSFGVDRYSKEIDFSSAFVDFPTEINTQRFLVEHPLLLIDGSIIIKSTSGPLLKFDECSQLQWINSSSNFHHSIELGPEGDIWVPSVMKPKTVQIGADDFRDDAITMLSPEGKILLQKSVIQILEENGLGYLIFGFGRAQADPIHLNDIEPALEDGILWKKGDVFVSLRHRSMVFLYRPHTNEILWHKLGPWLHQHDVDIVDENSIAVFNNNASLRDRRQWVVDGSNDETTFNFQTNTASRPFLMAFQKLDIRTSVEGRGQIFGNGEWLFAEETTFGRLLAFNRAGVVLFQYINRAKDGKVYYLKWSRLVARDLGDQAMEAIRKENCNEI